MSDLKIFVFLGPSLSLIEAQKCLPEAIFLPPVKCGDVLRLMRLKPDIIAVIDGVFEKTAAVWHKELLFALEQGVIVYGASSMGALRAAELAPYGMRGIGKIFSEYASGKLKDDDEVAVLHGAEAVGYRAITDPMVNIRATLEAAFTQGILSKTTAESLIRLAKNTFYQQRVLETLCQRQIENNLDLGEIKCLKNWIADGGYIDQKAFDAILLLKVIKNNASIEIPNTKPHLARSIYFRTLQRSMQCKPFFIYKDWLPPQEKIALLARMFGKNYLLLQRLAHLLALSYSIAQKQHFLKLDAPTLIGDEIYQKDWQENNDCFNTELEKYIDRLNSISCFLADGEVNNAEKLNYLIKLMQLGGDYSRLKQQVRFNQLPDETQATILATFKEKNKEKYNILSMIATLFYKIDLRAIKVGLVPNSAEIRNYAFKFRFSRQLQNSQAMFNWLEENDLSPECFENLMQLAIRFDFLVVGNNVDVLGACMLDNEAWWFLDALRLTGLYHKAKCILNDPIALEVFLREWSAANEKNADYAYLHDFDGGEAELNQFISLLYKQAKNSGQFLKK